VACSADGSKWLAADAGGGLWSSSDSGRSWTAATAPKAKWQAIACAPDGSGAFAAIWNVWAEEVSGIYRVETHPTLSISFSGEQAVISWPASAEGFTLQQSSSPVWGSWQNVDAESRIQDRRQMVMVSLTSDTRLYRLAKTN
jgi:hypothetical protein